MTQETTGIKAALSHPAIYDFVQNTLGARKARSVVAGEYLRLKQGELLVDVGCGTGEMFEFIPGGVSYVGFDMSEPYIHSARRRFGGKARFECMEVGRAAELDVRSADVALAFGLLHHLDDPEVTGLLATLNDIIRPGGRVITVDPTLFEGQSRLAAFVARRDRGRNVRSPAEYAALAGSVFPNTRHYVRNDLLRIPYSHCVMEMTRTKP